MVRDMDEFAGDVLDQLFFRRKRCFGIYGQADAGGDAEYVGVHRHIGLVVDDGGDDVGCFAADAGQLDEFVNGEGHLAVEFVHEHPGHADEVFSFVVGVRDAAHQGKQFVEVGEGKGPGIRVSVEDGRSRHIDPLVRALGGQDHRYQQLVRAVVYELGLCVRIVLAEVVQYELKSFLSGHWRVFNDREFTSIVYY